MAGVSGQVVYTKQPSAGNCAGRTVDLELWGRLNTALACSDFDASQQTLEDEELAVQIEVKDARRRASLPKLFLDGFELIEVPKAQCMPQDWLENKAEARRLAEAAAVDLVKVATGCTEAVAFDATWRSSARGNRDSSLGPGGRGANLSAAVSRVHADYTRESALRKISELVKLGTIPEAFGKQAEGRRAIVNVWRAFGAGETVQEAPLCLMHPKSMSIAGTEPFPYSLVHGTRAGINASVAYSDAHEWWHFPAMTKNEAILFYNFNEQLESPMPHGVFHSALMTPAQDGRPPRLSLEVRVIARWE
uniref:Uncharacterized protein n=1 Tax=Chrysotila carterae TaxID=13221 RepID=A0A7S4C1Z9_CHRCT